jgi:hypothetical protein
VGIPLDFSFLMAASTIFVPGRFFSDCPFDIE